MLLVCAVRAGTRINPNDSRTHPTNARRSEVVDAADKLIRDSSPLAALRRTTRQAKSDNTSRIFVRFPDIGKITFEAWQAADTPMLEGATCRRRAEHCRARSGFNESMVPTLYFVFDSWTRRKPPANQRPRPRGRPGATSSVAPARTPGATSSAMPARDIIIGRAHLDTAASPLGRRRDAGARRRSRCRARAPSRAAILAARPSSAAPPSR